jgi:hypothetical protein
MDIREWLVTREDRQQAMREFACTDWRELQDLKQEHWADLELERRKGN